MKHSVREESNTIGLIEFNKVTTNWENTVDANSGQLDNVILAKHFDIPLSDLESLTLEMQEYNRRILALNPDQNNPELAETVRAFVGSKIYDEDNDTYQMDIYLTGVKLNGEPIFFFNGTSAIYDFITPCPPTCVKEGGGPVLK